MQIGKAAGRAEIPGGGEIGLRFPGKAHHHVAGDGRVLHAAADIRQKSGIKGRIVTAAHFRQSTVAAGLQRDMQMGAELGLRFK